MKFENLNSDLFAQFEESKLSNIGKIVGGEKVCTDNADGGTCTDDKSEGDPPDFSSDCSTEWNP